MLDVTGDVHDVRTGKRSVETVELWKRDPVECIKELFSNPLFEEHMRYAHEPLFEDADATRPILNEMWTGEWWEKIQVRTYRKRFWLGLLMPYS